MVFAYFKRAKLEDGEYNKLNFFIALYLANTMEEDETEYKLEILPWLLGDNYWNKLKGFFFYYRNFFVRLNMRACVSRKCCEEIIDIFPQHDIWWKRERKVSHGGANLRYLKNRFLSPKGPTKTPVGCVVCQSGLPRRSKFLPYYSPKFPFNFDLNASPNLNTSLDGQCSCDECCPVDYNGSISGDSQLMYYHNSTSTNDFVQ
ncbi:speedy protein A-like [Gordionus sp. m RMFG-2023]|uniref:speedy protein A-like n=1 Tax=Gordionus sp. m RMFG-2023 TaxID=3053472 RepID=UPI0031FBE3C7